MKLRLPDSITLSLDRFDVDLTQQLAFEGGILSLELREGLSIRLQSKVHGIRFLTLRWNTPMRTDVKVLGDAWERGYGDLAWLPIDPARNMPWYMAISNGTDSNSDYTDRLTECFGVGVLPDSLALWNCDADGITLTLDLRNGCKPTYPGNAVIDCATVYMEEYPAISAFSALKKFCRVMSPSPLLADHVVYGSNNWYYAYGVSSHEEILADSRFVKKMCRDAENVPYMVIDDGWQLNNVDAPWDQTKACFPDMKLLAEEMKEIGVRPGIWVRYLINGFKGKRQVDTFPEEWYTQRSKFVLDPSHPGVLEYVTETTRRLVGWGYTLIKHDYSTFDLFGKWGFEIDGFPAQGEWGFYDNSLTTAQIIKNFYQTIRDAAGNTVIIGCNAMGHLCAGIHHFNRTGDDTSGKEWDRTRKMGINTLAFRLVQNNAFFGADADCVGITGQIEWAKNSQWLKILSRSGSCLFVSCKPGILNESELADLREGFLAGSRQDDELVPLDWMETVTPKHYLLNGQPVSFDW